MRRYREKNPSITVCSMGYPNNAVHDFIKGWGTIYKDGSILWHSWRPLRKKEMDRLKKWWASPEYQKTFTNFALPIVKKVFPKYSIHDICSVQPMDKYR